MRQHIVRMAGPLIYEWNAEDKMLYKTIQGTEIPYPRKPLMPIEEESLVDDFIDEDLRKEMYHEHR